MEGREPGGEWGKELEREGKWNGKRRRDGGVEGRGGQWKGGDGEGKGRVVMETFRPCHQHQVI